MEKPTLEYVQQLEQARRDEILREQLAIRNGLCPKCGSPIVVKEWKEAHPNSSWLDRLLNPSEVYVCEKDKSHYMQPVITFGDMM